MRNPGRPLPDCAASPLHPGYGSDNDKHMIEKPSAAHALPLAEGEGELAGRLMQNIVYFARALRAAGIPVGPKTIIDALDALKAAGVGTREDFYWTLHAVFVKRHEHSILFDQAFRLFFRKRAYLERLMAMMMSQVPAPATEAPKPASQRVQEALFAGLDEKLVRDNPEIEVDARLTMSANEILQKKDFAQMTTAEIAAAKDAIARLVLPLDELRTRRLAPHRHGHIIDIRRTFRASLKAGGAFIDLRYLGTKTRMPPIVVPVFSCSPRVMPAGVVGLPPVDVPPPVGVSQPSSRRHTGPVVPRAIVW